MTADGWLHGYVPATPIEAQDVERTRQLLAQAANPYDRALRVHLTGSAVVVHPPTRQVLLRWHERQKAWLQVGGHGDEGEADPFDVAMREAREETGLGDLAPWPGPYASPPVHVVVVPVAAVRDDPSHEHIDVRYLLATKTPKEARPERADAPIQWLPLDEAMDTVTENLAETLRRVAQRISIW